MQIFKEIFAVNQTVWQEKVFKEFFSISIDKITDIVYHVNMTLSRVVENTGSVKPGNLLGNFLFILKRC